jgi:hypothetical protein
VIVKSAIFWDIMPCNPLKINDVSEEVTFMFSVED